MHFVRARSSPTVYRDQAPFDSSARFAHEANAKHTPTPDPVTYSPIFPAKVAVSRPCAVSKLRGLICVRRVESNRRTIIFPLVKLRKAKARIAMKISVLLYLYTVYYNYITRMCPKVLGTDVSVELNPIGKRHVTKT